MKPTSDGDEQAAEEQSRVARLRAWWLRLRGTRRRFRQLVSDALRVLWICRIGTASVVIGWVLLCAVPQARDLFIDVSSGEGFWEYAGYASQAFIVAVAVFVLWALPVFAGARRALESPAWIYGDPMFRPAMENVEAEIDRRYGKLVEWVPGALGMGCFLAVLTGLLLLWNDHFDSSVNLSAARAQNQIIAHAIAMLIAAALFFLFLLKRRQLHDVTVGRATGEQLSGRKDTIARPEWDHQKIARRLGRASDVVLLLLLLVVFISPTMSWKLERAAALPLILGAWVPALSMLARRSHKVRLPMFALVLGALVMVTAIVGDYHDIRLIDAPKKSTGLQHHPSPGTQWTLNEAVEAWARANDCAPLNVPLGTPATKPCPSPVLIAIEGGASRAAFTAAATLGMLLDVTCDARVLSKGIWGCATRPKFADRVFAISGVSGGSLGAAVFSAAFDEAVENSQHSNGIMPPCTAGKGRFSLWFRSDTPMNWRECLEALLSGDFLSGPTIGMAIRDFFPFVLHLFARDWDRAALLEQAWIASLNDATGAGERSKFSRAFASFGPRADDWRPLLVFNGTSSATGRRVLTSHLHPVYQSALGPAVTAERRIFRDAYDFRELYRPFFAVTDGRRLCDRLGDESQVAADPLSSRDVSLATAVTNSARFPLISPPGTLSCQKTSTRWFGTKVIDRIVDGGYFENFGVTTVAEIATALHETFGLHPVVLMITNDPKSPREASALLSAGCSEPAPPQASDRPLFNSLLTPAGALYQTRSARGSYAIGDLASVLQFGDRVGCNGASPNIFHVTIFEETDVTGRSKSVSMSWWLSKSVQEFLDDQIPEDQVKLSRTTSQDHKILSGRMINWRSIMALCDAIETRDLCVSALGDPRAD